MPQVPPNKRHPIHHMMKSLVGEGSVIYVGAPSAQWVKQYLARYMVKINQKFRYSVRTLKVKNEHVLVQPKVFQVIRKEDVV